MPTLKIDGREISVPDGTTVLRAAKRLGIDIPVFCYHPGLSIAANCRMCLVDVAKVPKLVPACYTIVSDGMEVSTTSEKVQKTRESVLEFILLNHPVDCPICDQAGECVLQENYFTYSRRPSRLFTRKIHKPKARVLGPHVILDAERCVVCTRCVRFCEEITATNDLEVVERGEHSEITTFPGRTLDNPYSMNVIDICPVGALTSRDFRFQRRVWFMTKKPSLCTGCGRGCNIRVDSWQETTERYVPRYNPFVNRWWICDDGRLSYKHNRSTLLTGASKRGTGARTAVALHAATEALAGLLLSVRDDGARLAVVISASVTNEDAWVAARLAAALKADVYLGRRREWDGDGLLRAPDRDANTTGVTAILEALLPGAWKTQAVLEADLRAARMPGSVLFVGGDTELGDEATAALVELPNTVALASRRSALADAVALVAAVAYDHHRDGTMTNLDGWTQRLHGALKAGAGVLPAWVRLGNAAQAAGLDIGLTGAERPGRVFEMLAAEVPAFANLTYAILGELGGRLTHGAAPEPQPALVDGSPEWEPDTVAPSYERPFAIRRAAG